MSVPNGTKDIFRGTTHIDSKNESSFFLPLRGVRAILMTYAGVLLQAQKCFSQSFDTTLTPNGRLSEILKLRYSLCHSLYSNTKLLYYNEENMSIVFVKKILVGKQNFTQEILFPHYFLIF